MIDNILRRKQFVPFLTTIENFLWKHDPKDYDSLALSVLKDISNNLEAKKSVKKLVQGISTPVMKAGIARLAFKLNWLSPKEYESVVFRIVQQLLPPNMSQSEADTFFHLHSYGYLEPLHLESVLKKRHFSSKSFRNKFIIGAIGMIQPEDPEIQSAMITTGLSDVDPDVRKVTLAALGNRDTVSADLQKIFVHFLANDSHAGVRTIAAYQFMLLGRETKDVAVHRALVSSLQDSSEEVRTYAVQGLEISTPDDPEVVLGLVIGLKDPDEFIRRKTGEILRKIRPQDRRIKQAIRDIDSHFTIDW